MKKAVLERLEFSKKERLTIGICLFLLFSAVAAAVLLLIWVVTLSDGVSIETVTRKLPIYFLLIALLSCPASFLILKTEKNARQRKNNGDSAEVENEQ